MAQSLGFAEFLIEWYFLPHTKVISPTTYAGTPLYSPKLTISGLFLVIMGQFFRSIAMIEASSNFSHEIATEKRLTHTLVTSGVYALVRHPSYFGFFWWSVGTQVFLANPLSTVVFVAVLWRFFSSRIQYCSPFVSAVNI
jgi:protein-S-isoprenylcysteine O-methyltransferase